MGNEKSEGKKSISDYHLQASGSHHVLCDAVRMYCYVPLTRMHISS
jgi:hypothetical protein